MVTGVKREIPFPFGPVSGKLHVMGHQSLSPAWPREANTSLELRSLAETVWRLVQRDSSHAALHMVSRALRESGERSPGERRAYLLNLRGIVYAQQGKEAEALGDLAAAVKELPHWHIPWYNQALCHKRARRFAQMAQALQAAVSCLRGRAPGREPGRPILWNLGIAHTALGAWEEARACWRSCGVSVPPGPPTAAPEMDLGLAQLSLPTKGPYAAERVWVQRLDPSRARILSVVRFGAPCQFGDVVLCDEGAGHTGFLDGVVARDDAPDATGSGAGRENGMVFLDTLEAAGYVLHVVQGGPATPAQATALTERLREAELHIEVWSLTMRLPDVAHPPTDGSSVPVCAGLVIPSEAPESQGQQVIERAAQELAEAGRELGLCLYAPTLMLAAGDELGAARHRKALRQLIGTQ